MRLFKAGKLSKNYPPSVKTKKIDFASFNFI